VVLAFTGTVNETRDAWFTTKGARVVEFHEAVRSLWFMHLTWLTAFHQSRALTGCLSEVTCQRPRLK
jgi:hypothetical protein